MSTVVVAVVAAAPAAAEAAVVRLPSEPLFRFQFGNDKPLSFAAAPSQ